MTMNLGPQERTLLAEPFESGPPTPWHEYCEAVLSAASYCTADSPEDESDGIRIAQRYARTAGRCMPGVRR